MKQFAKKHRWWLVGLLILLVAGCAVGIAKRRARQTVSLGQAKRGKILEAVYGIGTVTASRTYQLKVGVTSTIRDLYVREGDYIKKGTKLLYLDGAAAIFAPFNGTITSLPNKVGETVFPQVPILTLTDLSDRYLVVSLEQQAAIRVQKGQFARLSFESLRDQSFEGKVEAIYSNDNNYLVRIGTSSLPAQILPGMTVDVAIGIREHENALLVPVAAINSGKMWIVRHGKKQVVEVQVGTVDGSIAEIVSGDIQEGDTILLWRG